MTRRQRKKIMKRLYLAFREQVRYGLARWKVLRAYQTIRNPKDYLRLWRV